MSFNFKSLLASFKSPAKTLDQARSTLEASGPVLESVAALFKAENLDLDAMLAAGPDSLKAHCDGLRAKDAELATAQSKLTELTSQLATVTTDAATHEAAAKAVRGQLDAVHAAVGYKADAEKADFGATLKEYVAKQSALILAKDGRPAVTHVNADAIAGGKTISYEAYQAMGPVEKKKFFAEGGKLADLPINPLVSR